MIRTRDIFHRKGTLFEALVAFVCWSCTYLFIRRLGNPETRSVALTKFSGDAVYGGIAAATAVVMKSILIANANYVVNDLASGSIGVVLDEVKL